MFTTETVVKMQFIVTRIFYFILKFLGKHDFFNKKYKFYKFA